MFTRILTNGTKYQINSNTPEHLTYSAKLISSGIYTNAEVMDRILMRIFIVIWQKNIEISKSSVLQTKFIVS